VTLRVALGLLTPALTVVERLVMALAIPIVPVTGNLFSSQPPSAAMS
jgi:hypothetical protein